MTRERKASEKYNFTDETPAEEDKTLKLNEKKHEYCAIETLKQYIHA